MAVMDAKTGAILGYSGTPSFDPNKKDITNYVDLLTGTTYEPGSTMKIFSYLCSIDNNLYDGSATYKSGNIEYVTGSDGKIITTPPIIFRINPIHSKRHNRQYICSNRGIWPCGIDFTRCFCHEFKCRSSRVIKKWNVR